MELRELATFQAVARTLSFTQAAAQLGYAQSSVTVHIQALEAELGVPLFDRIGRRVALTEAGKHLLGYAEQLLDMAAEARYSIARHSSTNALEGTLTISAPETICTYRLPSVLHAFRAIAPKVRVIFVPLTSSVIYQSVRDGRVDVGLGLDAPLQSTQLCIETLLSEPVLVVARPDHPLSSVESILPKAVEAETLLLTEHGCGYRAMFERDLEQDGVHPLSVMEFNSVEAIKQCAIAGLGIAVLPEITVQKHLNRAELVALKWHTSFTVHTQLLWHAERWQSPAVSAFLDVARQSFPKDAEAG